MGAYTNSRDAYASKTFSGQLLVTMVLNWLINFLWQWGSMGGFSSFATSKGWPSITAFNMHTSLNSCLALDMLLTTFFIGSLCSLAGTGGTQQEVKDKKCEALDPQVFEVERHWRYTPVVIRALGLRSLALGLFTTALVGLPSFLIVWAAVGAGSIPGEAYVIFKGFWASLVSGFVYTFVFPPAIDRRNFPELEFEEFSKETLGEGEEAPPMVGNPSFI